MTARRLRLALFGSTGSIGRQTLDVVRHLQGQGWDISVNVLASGHDSEAFRGQIRSFNPHAVGVADPAAAETLDAAFPELETRAGAKGLAELALRDDVDLVVNAAVGFGGLPITWAAVCEGRRIALANKESLVIAGQTLRTLLTQHGGSIISIDSEHHALHQCLEGRRIAEVSRLLITASGGPFRDRAVDSLSAVTPDEALQHPTWSMGKRITIDSATMVNKAFEVIGAHVLYELPYERIEVLVHPQSLVHSMVEFLDGSTLAELGPRDMRIPIQNALIYPDRVPAGLGVLPWDEGVQLTFELLRRDQFPAFGAVLQAAEIGEGALAAANAADEVLIDRFLAADIRFPDISHGLHSTVEAWSRKGRGLPVPATLEALVEADAWGRAFAQALTFPHARNR